MAAQYFHAVPWVAWSDAGQRDPLPAQAGEELMWRMRVLHATGYAYPSPATASYNEARLTPRSDSRQNVVLNRVETVPATRSYRYIDYWGTAVTAFDLHAPHTELTVTSASVVETERPDPPDREARLVGPAERGRDRSVRRIAASDRVHAGKQTHCGRGQADRQGARTRRCRPRGGRMGAQRTGLRQGHHRRALVGSGRACAKAKASARTSFTCR